MHQPWLAALGSGLQYSLNHNTNVFFSIKFVPKWSAIKSWLFCLCFEYINPNHLHIKLIHGYTSFQQSELYSVLGKRLTPLQWRHNGRDSISNHQPNDCLLSRLLRRRWKKTSKLRVTGLCSGNSPVTGEFPAQRASNAENASIWRRHHALMYVDSCNWFGAVSIMMYLMFRF